MDSMPTTDQVKERAERILRACARAGRDEAEVYVKGSRTRRLLVAAGAGCDEESRTEIGIAVRSFVGDLCDFGAGSWSEPDPPLARLQRSGRGHRHGAWLPSADTSALPGVAAEIPIEPENLRAAAGAVIAGLGSGSCEISATDLVEWIFNSHGVEVSMTGGIFVLDLRRGRATARCVSRSVRELDVSGAMIELVSHIERQPVVRALPDRVVLAPPAASHLAALLAESIRADRVQAGLSPVSSSDEGHLCLAKEITAVDDTSAGPFGRRFDAEGFAAGPRQVISAGRLVTLLYDTRAADISGRSSTGNSVRRSYLTPPAVGSSCFTIVAGHQREDLLRDAEVEIVRFSPPRRWDPATGTFLFRGCGYALSNGKRSIPVTVQLNGNLLDLWRHVEATGDDFAASAHDGWVGSPSLLLRRR